MENGDIEGCKGVNWVEFCERVCLLMGEMDLSTAYELAYYSTGIELGMDTLRSIVAGEDVKRQRNTVEKLAKFFNVSVHYLLYGGNDRGSYGLGKKSKTKLDSEIGSYEIILDNGRSIVVEMNQKKEFYIDRLKNMSCETLRHVYSLALVLNLINSK